MPNTHREMVDADLHVPGYVQDSDPGAIGAYRLWIDTSLGTGKWVMKVRKADDTGWEAATVYATRLLLLNTTTAAYHELYLENDEDGNPTLVIGPSV